MKKVKLTKQEIERNQRLDEAADSLREVERYLTVAHQAISDEQFGVVRLLLDDVIDKMYNARRCFDEITNDGWQSAKDIYLKGLA
jgi:hypothetical protein